MTYRADTASVAPAPAPWPAAPGRQALIRQNILEAMAIYTLALEQARAHGGGEGYSDSHEANATGNTIANLLDTACRAIEHAGQMAKEIDT